MNLQMLLIIRLFLFGLIFTHVACSKPTQLRTSALTDVIGVEEGAIEEGIFDNASESPLLALIGAAEDSLDVAIYEVRDPDVRQSLIEASGRGITVRILIEPQPVGVGCDVTDTDGEAGNANCEIRRQIVSEFIQAGIEVVAFDKQLCGMGNTRCFQHGKLLIVDGHTALMSTGNFNSSSLCSTSANPSTCNRDYSVVTKDPEILETLQAIFDHDFLQTPYNLEQFLPDDIRTRLTVSPHAHTTILDFINEAQTNLRIQGQYLREPALNEAIIGAASRGVNVEVTLASNCSFTTFLNENTRNRHRATYEPLIEAGVDLRFFTKLNQIQGKQAYMHAKLIIVDDRVAWVGSINGSVGAFQANREFGMFVDDGRSLDKVLTIFAEDHESEVNETLEPNLRCVAERGA